MDYLFGEWLPEAPDYQNPGLTECKNVYPSGSRYSPFLGATSTGVDIGSAVIGAARFDRTDGTRVIVCGTATDLHVIVSGTATASSLGLSVSADDVWRFEQFGAEIYATAKSVGTFKLTDIDSDTSFAAVASSPSGDAVARIGDFLVLGNLTDIDASDRPYGIRWSSFNNPGGSWTSDIATQAGAVDMPSRYGPVTGLSGGQVGLILQKYGVSRIQYTGGPNVFHKEVIDEERGCVSPGSVVRVGDYTYFAAYDGFCRTAGDRVEVLSAGRVWDWFRENSDMTYISRVHGALDWPNRCVIWNFYGSGQTSYTGQMIYNWEQNRWSHSVVSNDWMVESTQAGLTLEELAVLYPDLDAMTTSLDSPVWAAQGRMLSCFVSGVFSDFNGDALAAEFETGDFQLISGRRSFVSEVTPLVENSSANTQIAVGTRSTAGGAVSYTSDISEGPHGFCALNADGRYARVRMKIPAAANWDKATGFQVEAQPSGRG